MTLRGHEKLQVIGNVVHRVVDGQPVLLDLESQQTIRIDSLGVEVWRMVTHGDDVSTMRESILDRFDTDAETVRRDLDQLVGELVGHGVLRVLG